MKIINSIQKNTKFLLTFSVLLIILISAYLVITNFISSQENGRAERGKKQLIVLISSDGLGSYLLGENTPFLYSLLQQDNTSYTLDMLTIEQSETMPSHISMLTGLKQENHKFYQNTLTENTPLIEEKTLFDYAKKNGYKFYSFVTKDKLLYLLGEKRGENIVYKEEYSSDIIDDFDSLVNPESDKVFVFLHLRDIDSLGHTYGWNSNEQQIALQTLDSNLRLFTDDLIREFEDYERYFIFTADHGGEGTQHSNGCEKCRKIPFIVITENTSTKYNLSSNVDNIYDTTCVVLDLMKDNMPKDLDCRK